MIQTKNNLKVNSIILRPESSFLCSLHGRCSINGNVGYTNAIYFEDFYDFSTFGYWMDPKYQYIAFIITGYKDAGITLTHVSGAPNKYTASIDRILLQAITDDNKLKLKVELSGQNNDINTVVFDATIVCEITYNILIL